MLRTLRIRGTCDHSLVLRRFAPKVAAFAGVALLVLVLAVVAKSWWESRIPGTYSVMSYGTHDYGGGPVPPDHTGHGGGLSVGDLHGQRVIVPDARFTLVAKSAVVRLASGRTIDALTFNGMSPGPELRVRQGDDVAVELVNEDVEQGVTIHWHGVDVPNAEDGVAGVTQNAVLPGERYTYRFRVEQVGTFWYHTHQVSSTEVKRGLFGVLVIEPRTEPTGIDIAVVVHTFDGIPTLNGHESPGRMRVAAGTPVRVRLINTDSVPQRLTVVGSTLPRARNRRNRAQRSRRSSSTSRYRSPPEGASTSASPSQRTASGSASRERTPRSGSSSSSGPRLRSRPRPGTSTRSRTVSRRRRSSTPRRRSTGASSSPSPASPASSTVVRDCSGRSTAAIYPDVPMFVVEEGDLVELTITNDTKVVHPMHLHGHHVLVLSRDGEAATGSPWWSDTLNVLPGERYVVALRADNPGVWMDHCHNLAHAAEGLTMHLAYAGVTTPFLVGAAHHNKPE